MTPDLALPRTVREACQLLAEHDGTPKVIAGGTAVVLMMRQGLIFPSLLVSLERVEDLSSIEITDGYLHVGGKVSLTQVAASNVVRTHFPSLARACSSVGNIRVRNAATLAGNLAEADYASDPPSALISLSASCLVENLEGTRSIPVSELITGFYSTALGPTDVITSVRVPMPSPTQRAEYFRFVSRSSEDRPCVSVAARTSLQDGLIEDLNVVVGAVAPTPAVLPEICSQVVGRPLDDKAISIVAEGYAGTIDAMEDLRASKWYRTEMIRVFVRRALDALRTAHD